VQLLDLPENTRVERDREAAGVSLAARRGRADRLPVRRQERTPPVLQAVRRGPFGRGYVEQIGGDFVSINLGALDNASDEELATVPVQFMNGRDNDWFNAPPVSRHL
jgi:hypothetical protein